MQCVDFVLFKFKLKVLATLMFNLANLIADHPLYMQVHASIALTVESHNYAPLA